MNETNDARGNDYARKRRQLRQRIASSAAAAALAAFALTGAARAQKAAVLVPPQTPGLAPDAPPQFTPATRSIARFRIPPGLKVSVFAAEPQLTNPVCFFQDPRGRFWVVETNRYGGGGAIDQRTIMGWLEDELASRTVEDRVAATKRNLPPDQFAAMAINSDDVRILEDTHGTGRADRSTVFATGFNDVADGIAAGVLVRGNDVWFTDIPHFWLLHDDGRGACDQRTSLSEGYGVHYAHTGHDLHCPIFGPDGKIYMSTGDRGLHVKTDRGVINLPDTGGVLRCDPDGANLELYAYGLRNPQEIAFDEYGNLFTGDNNSDLGDPARFCYVVEGGDGGWRIGYQNMKEPDVTGPWRSEDMCAIGAANHCYSIVPPVGHVTSGPAGLAYHPGTGLQEKYKGHFLLCDFRGGFIGSGIHSFAAKPSGATFDMVDHTEFIWNVLATDVLFGIDGSVYLTDWTSGWDRPNKGRIYRVYDPDVVSSPIVSETKELISEGMASRAPYELARLLGHADMRVRQEAQFELARRGSDSIPLFAAVATKDEHQLARVHAIWGLGQLGRKTPAAYDAVLPLLADADPEIRAQAARVLGDGRVMASFDQMLKLLSDPSPRVRFFSAQGLGKLGRGEALKPLLAMLAENADKDPLLRHAGVMGLVGIGDVAALLAAADDPFPSARMGVLLALRRLGRTEVTRFLHDGDPDLVLEAARAINDGPIDAAMPQLADLGDAAAANGAPLLHRVLNANCRLGTAERAAVVARVAARADAPEACRVEALEMLSTWAKPSNLDRVTGLWRPLPARDGRVALDAARPVIAEVLRAAPDPVRLAALELAQKTGVPDASVLSGLVADKARPPEVRAAALEAMSVANDPKLVPAIDAAMVDADPKVRGAAIRLQARFPDALQRLDALLSSGSPADQQAVFDTLATVKSAAADEIYRRWLARLKAGQVAAEAQLDLLEAAATSRDPGVAAAVRAYNDSRPKDDPLLGYREALLGGDAAAGRRIFRERASVSCVRCHTLNGQGGLAGPDLAHVGSRSTREYLLESIVYPNRKIAPGFESVVLKMKDGKGYAATVKTETDEQLTLELPDKSMVTVKKSDIATRTRAPSAMPEGFGQILSKRDLRNLVEFLAQRK